MTKKIKTSNAKVFLESFALILFLSLFFGKAVTVENINEHVDISEFSQSKITLYYSISGTYISSIDKNTLQNRCDMLIGVTSCTPSLLPDKNVIQFELESENIFSLEDITVSDEEVELSFLYTYKPHQFMLSSGFIVNKRQLEILLPSHKTTFINLVDEPYETLFSSSFEKIDKDWIFDEEFIIDGEPVNIVPETGDFCGAGILENNDLKASHLSMDCSFLTIPTDNLGGSTVTVFYFVVENNIVHYAEDTLTIKPSEFESFIRTDKSKIILGTSFSLHFSANESLSHCSIEIKDKKSETVFSKSSANCKPLIVGTSPSWEAGHYHIKAILHTDKQKSFATTAVLCEKAWDEKVDIILEETVFSPGDTIHLLLSGDGDYCITDLFNMENVKVATGDSHSCTKVNIELSKHIPGGNYVIRTKVYEHLTLKSVVTKSIQIRQWEIKKKTVRSDLCQNGFFQVLNSRIGCISTGELCIPTSQELPLCLCFDSSGEPVDACNYGYRCQNNGCKEKGVKSPYIIIFEENQCFAKMGTLTLKCITEGEACYGRCICLDENNIPLSTCTVGSSCGKQGCIDTVIEFKVSEISTNQATVDDFENGFDLTWKGILKYEDNIMTSSNEDLLEIKASLSVLESEEIVIDFDPLLNQWMFTAHFKGVLTPGKYDTFLSITYDNAPVHTSRIPFEVHFSKSEKELDIDVKMVYPQKIPLNRFKYGLPIEIKSVITDSHNKEIPTINSEDISIKIGQLEANSIGLSYDRQFNYWKIIPVFQSETLPTNAEVYIEIDSLGRKGIKYMDLELVEYTPLSIDIDIISPGTVDNPFYYFLFSLGFNLDIYLTVENKEGLREDNFQVKMNGKDISEKITYLISTPEGTKLHLSNVDLCPNPPMPGERLKVDVIATDGLQISEASKNLIIEGNPGNWEHLGGSC